MSRTLRLIGAVALATATVPFLGVSPAYAESTTLPASAQGYFNASGIAKPDQSPAAPPNPIASVDGVEKDHLAVAAKAGTEDKVSALLFDLGALDVGSLVSKATLTLPLAEGGGNLQSNGAPEKVRACMAGDAGFGGEDGAALSLAPERLCDAFSAPGKFSADKKSYVFELTALAQIWVDKANDGLTLTAAKGAATTPFQVVFKPGKDAKLEIQYTAAPADVIDTAPPVDTSGSSGTTSPDLGGFSGGVAPAPPVDGGFGSVESPVVPEAPAPAANVAPQAAAPVTAPVAAAGPVDLEKLQPTTAFWLGALLLAAVLALLSLIMGDAAVPSATSRPSRLSKALADRQRGAGTSLARPTFARTATI